MVEKIKSLIENFTVETYQLIGQMVFIVVNLFNIFYGVM
jgi:hypothetical protein